MQILESPQAELFEHTLDWVVWSAIAGHIPGQVKIMNITWPAWLCIPDSRYVLPAGTPVNIIGHRGNFSIGLAGCTITYMVAIALDLFAVEAAIETILGMMLVRSLLLLGCLWAIAVIHESIR